MLGHRAARAAFGHVTAARAFSAKAASATSGALYMCGTGESHKLGLGDTKDRETPVLVEALPDWFYIGVLLYCDSWSLLNGRGCTTLARSAVRVIQWYVI